MSLYAGFNTASSVRIADSAGNLNMGSATRQMISLYGDGQYGIGVQSSTTYYRTQGYHAWFYAGVHDDVALAPGAGGTLQGYVSNSEWVMKLPMYVDTTGNAIYFRKTDGTQMGRLYHDNSSAFGILNSVGGWAFYCTSTATNVYGYNGTSQSQLMLSAYDTWVRLNPNGSFSNGVYTPGNMRIDGTLYLNSASVGMSVSSGALNVVTASGNVQIGPQNTSYCHFITDRSNFYFNRNTEINGALLDYNGGVPRPYLKIASPTGVSTGGNVTFSTAAPTGGVNGDIWFKYT